MVTAECQTTTIAALLSGSFFCSVSAETAAAVDFSAEADVDAMMTVAATAVSG